MTFIRKREREEEGRKGKEGKIRGGKKTIIRLSRRKLCWNILLPSVSPIIPVTLIILNFIIRERWRCVIHRVSGTSRPCLTDPLHNTVTTETPVAKLRRWPDKSLRPQFSARGGRGGYGRRKRVAAWARTAISRRKRTNQGINLLYQAGGLTGREVKGWKREEPECAHIYVCKWI